MQGGQQLHVRTDLHVVADGDGRNVEADQAEVREGTGPDEGLIAVVAPERRSDDQQLLLGLAVARVHGVEPVGQLQGTMVVASQIRIVGDVHVTGEHSLPHGPPVRRILMPIGHTYKRTDDVYDRA
jgi:hypothetical protein